MTLTWSLDPLTVQDEEQQRQLSKDQSLIVAHDGRHEWVATLEALEDGGGVSLSCVGCPADTDYLLVAGIEYIHGEVHGIPIREGRHLSLVEYTAPVSVRVVVEEHSGPNYITPEYDVWIEVSDAAQS